MDSVNCSRAQLGLSKVGLGEIREVLNQPNLTKVPYQTQPSHRQQPQMSCMPLANHRHHSLVLLSRDLFRVQRVNLLSKLNIVLLCFCIQGTLMGKVDLYKRQC